MPFKCPVHLIYDLDYSVEVNCKYEGMRILIQANETGFLHRGEALLLCRKGRAGRVRASCHNYAALRIWPLAALCPFGAAGLSTTPRSSFCAHVAFISLTFTVCVCGSRTMCCVPTSREPETEACVWETHLLRTLWRALSYSKCWTCGLWLP